MDSSSIDVVTLINSVLPYLIMAAPYLKQLALASANEAANDISTEAGKKLGDKSWRLAKSIWQELRRAKPETQTAIDSALSDVAGDPDDADTHVALRLKLKQALKEDSALVKELAQLVHEAESTNVEGDRNVLFGENASNNVVATGDGIVVGDRNINLVNKKL